MTARAEAALYALDPARLASFYTAVAGLNVTAREEGFIELCSDTWRITIVAIPPHIADGIPLDDPAVRREEAPIKLVLPVASLEEARSSALARGGVVDGPEREWTWRELTRCDGHDPEGNVFQCAAPRS